MDLAPETIFGLLKSTDDFVVDLDDAWKWIGWREKRDAKDVLIRNFEEGVDFSGFGTKSPSGGRPSEWILLTIDCFKSLAMMAGTSQGKAVRKHFLDCEKQLKLIVSSHYKVTLDQEWSMWQQRYDIRIDLKDRLRPELMSLVAKWAEDNAKSPRKVCSQVHDGMNERIQGIKSQVIKHRTGLSAGDLIRDYFGTEPLTVYAAINKLSINFIVDEKLAPLVALHKACDIYLSRSYSPKPLPIVENLYSQGKRLKVARRVKQLEQGNQLSLFSESQAS